MNAPHGQATLILRNRRMADALHWNLLLSVILPQPNNATCSFVLLSPPILASAISELMQMQTVHAVLAVCDKIWNDGRRPSVKAHCASNLDSIPRNDGRFVALHICAISAKLVKLAHWCHSPAHSSSSIGRNVLNPRRPVGSSVCMLRSLHHFGAYYGTFAQSPELCLY